MTDHFLACDWLEDRMALKIFRYSVDDWACMCEQAIGEA